MRSSLLNLVDHLQLLKRAGISSISINESTLEDLTAKIESLIPSNTTPVKEEKPRVTREVPQVTVDFSQKTAIEIPTKLQVKAITPEISTTLVPPEVILPTGTKQERWNYLRDKVLSCKECNSHIKPGKKVVFGIGSLESKIFFCGEAPGAEEEIEGEPFVGKAGQLLTKIIQAMGVTREEVYIGNIMNWRPEMPTAIGNRPPTQEEMNFCLPYLKAQVEIIKPEVIVALGATAVSGLLGPDSKRKMGDIRGKWASFMGIPVMVTFHPSYLLRNNTMRTKRMVWEDVLLVMERVGMGITAKQRDYFL